MPARLCGLVDSTYTHSYTHSHTHLHTLIVLYFYCTRNVWQQLGDVSAAVRGASTLRTCALNARLKRGEKIGPTPKEKTQSNKSKQKIKQEHNSADSVARGRCTVMRGMHLRKWHTPLPDGHLQLVGNMEFFNQMRGSSTRKYVHAMWFTLLI